MVCDLYFIVGGVPFGVQSYFWFIRSFLRIIDLGLQMNFQFLKYFSVLAEELHFGRAAEKLSMTQPPLSAAIKSLEEELDVVLFTRTNKKVELTPEGTVFLKEARSILDQTARAKSIVRAAKHGVIGRLEVGLSPSLIYRGVIDAVDEFVRMNPHIDINLHEMPMREQFGNIESGKIDVGFTNAPVVPPGMRSWHLRDDVFALFVPENHPLAKCESVNIADLESERFVLFSKDIGPENYANVINIFVRAAIYPRTVHQVRSWLSTLALVSRGAGIAVMPVSMANSHMAGVRFVPLQGEATIAPAVMIWNREENAVLSKFVACAQEVLSR